MKLFSVIFILFIFNIPQQKLAASIPHCQFQDSLAIKAARLRKLYVLATASPGESKDVYKQQFFDAFPNTFKQLNELYGYDFKAHKGAPLYLEVEKHIEELFNSLDNIDEMEYYKKIVSIAIGGQWDADAVNAFQEGLRQRVLANPKLIVDILKQMPDEKIQSFWYFYFDDIHPARQIAEPLQRIKAMDIKIYNLMVEAQKAVLKQK